MDGIPFVNLLQFGLLGITTLAFLEKFVPVVPSYVLFVLIGLTEVHDSGGLAGAVLASTLGSLLGALGWYSIGRAAGPDRCKRLVERFGKYLLLRLETYNRLTDSYRRHNFVVTAIGQTIPTARIYLALPAGVLRLPFKPFVLATTAGTLAWNGPLISIGYLLRDTGWSPSATGAAVAAATITLEALVLSLVARARQARQEPYAR